MKRRDHLGNIYSLNAGFFESYLTYPFRAKKDLIDATSRLYDIEPVTPVFIDEKDLEPEAYVDGRLTCGSQTAAQLLEDLRGLQHQRIRKRDTESRCGPLVQAQFELGWLFDRKVGRFGAFQNPVYVAGRAPKHVCNVGAVAHQRAVAHTRARPPSRR